MNERRIKRQIHGRPQRALARFPKGLGEVCRAEIAALLEAPMFPDRDKATVTLTSAAVEIDGIGFRELLALPLRVTTARELLWEIADVKADGPNRLKERLAEVPWDDFFPRGEKVGVRVTSTASRVYHEGLMRDAVGAALQKSGIYATAASSGLQLLDARLFHDRLTLSLSLSGRPLHHRGYKTELSGAASVKEDLAQGAVRLALAQARFTPDEVWNPFAGSGTLGFEAALTLGGIAPAVFAPKLGCERWVCAPPATTGFVRRKLAETAGPAKPPVVRFVEKDAKASAGLRENAAHFASRVPGAVFETEEGDAFAALPKGQKVLALVNPPYGDRLESADYRKVADLLVKAADGRELAGCVFVPTGGAVRDLVGNLVGAYGAFRTKETPVSHGGKNVTLVAFASQAI